MKLSGHWFCDHCDDVVFMSYERVTMRNVPCPVCGRLACNFIPRRISRKELGECWFASMRRVVDEATTPELDDLRPHKNIL
jgi:hypothetical protein